jgi:spore coat protein CotH
MKLRRFALAMIVIGCVVALSNCGGGGSHNKLIFGTGTGTGTGDPPPDYAVIYNRSTLDEYELEFTAGNWQTLKGNPFEYVPGVLKFKTETYNNVGIRFKGNSSYFAPMSGDKKSFKVHFNEYDPNTRFHGLKKLNFHNSFKDPSLMREMVGYDVFAAANCPASRASHIKLYLTVPGTYAREYFGVYISVEQVNKAYFADRFPESDGNLYKAGQSGGNLRYLGADKSLYTTPINDPPYEKKTNEIEDDWTDFIHFLDVLNNTPDPSFKTEIEKVFNVNGFLDYMAANTVLSNLDSITGRQCNWYLYHNMVTGKFEFLPWDLNEVFGNFHCPGQDADTMLTLNIYDPTGGAGPHVLPDRILGVAEYVTSYEGKLRALIDGGFAPAPMHSGIDGIYNRIKADVYIDTHKPYTNNDFDRNVYEDIPNDTDPKRVLGLKPFVTDRVASVDSQLP